MKLIQSNKQEKKFVDIQDLMNRLFGRPMNVASVLDYREKVFLEHRDEKIKIQFFDPRQRTGKWYNRDHGTLYTLNISEQDLTEYYGNFESLYIHNRNDYGEKKNGFTFRYGPKTTEISPSKLRVD